MFLKKSFSAKEHSNIFNSYWSNLDWFINYKICKIGKCKFLKNVYFILATRSYKLRVLLSNSRPTQQNKILDLVNWAQISYLVWILRKFINQYTKLSFIRNCLVSITLTLLIVILKRLVCLSILFFFPMATSAYLWLRI